MTKIESFFSARLFLSPQRVKDKIYFLSNLSGQISLYRMDFTGSVPEPLLPADIALQNPLLLTPGKSFYVYPSQGKILVMIDSNGDENYQPMLIPESGGYPEFAFGDLREECRFFFMEGDAEHNYAFLRGDSWKDPLMQAFHADVEKGKLEKIFGSSWFTNAGVNGDQTKAALIERYSHGDNVLYLWEKGVEVVELIFGTPLELRDLDQEIELQSIQAPHFVDGDKGLLLITSLFDDCYGLAYLAFGNPQKLEPVEVVGVVHEGHGEMSALDKLEGNRYQVTYNIDGGSWAYEGAFDQQALQIQLEHVLCGQGTLSQGHLQSFRYDNETDSYTFSFSNATSPAQIYSLGGSGREETVVHTRERLLGIPDTMLSKGEEASYESFDGLRVSARLYLPADDQSHSEPFPLVYYVHGGPHSQERPNFTWFSMPLIQFLTTHGFAVFVPNVRGSSGYGLKYTKLVDRDWGGDDRLDHVHAIEVLKADERIDTSRVGLVGRSYGGYMTLILAGQHPELWSAAVDMFGPYDLLTFLERIPPTWKPYYKIALGDVEDEADRKFLIERSPKTHLHQLACPMLVIQGKNDPRVVENESSDLIEDLKAQGKEIEYLLFENEGHDVLKYENRVRCYTAIKDFFVEHV
jgi:pimeloyl-ACP methyl ester carboxylesterase